VLPRRNRLRRAQHGRPRRGSAGAPCSCGDATPADRRRSSRHAPTDPLTGSTEGQHGRRCTGCQRVRMSGLGCSHAHL